MTNILPMYPNTLRYAYTNYKKELHKVNFLLFMAPWLCKELTYSRI